MDTYLSDDPLAVFLRSLDDGQRAYLLGYMSSMIGLEKAREIIQQHDESYAEFAARWGISGDDDVVVGLGQAPPAPALGVDDVPEPPGLDLVLDGAGDHLDDGLVP